MPCSDEAFWLCSSVHFFVAPSGWSSPVPPVRVSLACQGVRFCSPGSGVAFNFPRLHE